MDKSKCKLYDLINIKEWEVKSSILATIIFVGFFWYVDLYRNIAEFIDVLCSCIECLIGALIGLLGFTLSGITIIVSLFTKTEIKLIKRVNNKDIVTEVLSSYVFLAENIAVQCVCLFIINIILNSNLPIVDIGIFYFLIAIEVYHIVFIVFYTTALVKNCIKIYRIKSLYDDIDSVEKRDYELVNEIKIDYILSIIMNDHNISLEQIVTEIVDLIEKSGIEKKDKVIRYIKNQYDIK